MARVFSKLASPHEAREVPLGRQKIFGVPFNIEARSCRSYPAQNLNICVWAKKYISDVGSVLEAGTST